MSPLEIQINNAHLASRYDFFINDHIQQYMHQSLDSWFVIFHGVKQHS
jgi:hypothetical protein